MFIWIICVRLLGANFLSLYKDLYATAYMCINNINMYAFAGLIFH